MIQLQLSLSTEIGKKNPNTAEDYFKTQVLNTEFINLCHEIIAIHSLWDAKKFQI